MEYTRRDLAQAVLDAHPDSSRGLNMFYGAFNDDMKAFQIRLRDGLLGAFGVDLNAHMPLKMLLKSTVDSNAAITSPGSGFGEFSAIARKLEGSGVIDRMMEIARLNDESQKIHLDIVEELLGLMQPTAEVVTSEDLKALGVDDDPPDVNDYEMDY
ncbi:hypothetical protein C8D87_1021029 [Lentzea atacamensis]|uniref:Uncharacterized protein n=1 Tax=Lentzea atacamensis TaxID=531938 RepID=A0ABX9EE85_9PSEU|nr:hypothetical protein [Lentzea atacamensis]RAS68951.1 hypothetical protein C8D87_1021029 [Lentzea atacamensis]